MAQASARWQLSQFTESGRLLEQAAQLASEPGLGSLPLEVECWIGLVLSSRGDYEAADRHFRAILDAAIRLGDRYLETGACAGLGFSLLRRARFDEALPWCERAAALARQIGARVHEVSALGNAGRCYWGLGEFEKAESLLSQAAELTGKMGDLRRRQTWLRALGDLALEARGDFAGAAVLYEQALALSRQLENTATAASLRCQLANVALHSGDLAAAERHTEEAMRLSRKSGYRSVMKDAVFCAAKIRAARGDFPGAEAGFRQVLAAVSETEDRNSIWEAHSALARLYEANHRADVAALEYQSALTALESMRAKLPRDEWKLSFQSASKQFYSDYVGLLMGRGETGRALEVVEWSRARVLAQKLGVLDATLHLNAVSRFRDIARAHRATLVSLWLGPKRSFAWVVTPKGVTAAALPPEAEFTSLVEAFQAAVQGLRDPLETANPAARRLSEALLAPLARLVPRGSRVILVPDGALHQLNLEALPAPSGPPRYWIEDVSVEIAPSLALLGNGAPAAAPRNAKSLLLIGAPIASPDFPPLQDVANEVASVQRRFSSPVVLTGAAAYPAAYREAQPGRFQYIHFAAHATANRENPLESAVILSPRGETAKLYAREVVGAPLRATLVTISACRGAGSRIYSGEGLVGFAWAFLQAGARNVVAGLWDVNDRSTALLMDRLYAGLAAGRTPPAALRAAKLELLRSAGPYRKPYYWAGFQLFTRFPE